MPRNVDDHSSWKHQFDQRAVFNIWKRLIDCRNSALPEDI
jgi:hypothetical protein